MLDAASEHAKGKDKIGSTLKGLAQLTWTKQDATDFELETLNYLTLNHDTLNS